MLANDDVRTDYVVVLVI